MIHAGRALVACCLLWTLTMPPAESAPAPVDGARLEPVSFGDLAGWDRDDHAEAFRAFLRSCKAVEALRPAQAPHPDLLAVCREALRAGALPDAAARGFFETYFRPVAVVPHTGSGFLTGYYEPEFQGSRTRDAIYRVPLLNRPGDLVTIPHGEALTGLDKGLQAARRTAAGYEPYPDRAAIEDGALGAQARPILWLRDAVDLLVLQVQGSGRVRLPDGRAVRVLYDGRNGRPYTAVAKLIVQEGHLPLEGLTLARWTGWLRDHPDTARRLIRANASYIFFRLADVADPALGPPGAANAPLSPGYSLAVDAGLWRYGLPFWLAGKLPDRAEGAAGRLVIAADTGSAIVGPARGDLFVGTGARAGIVAGNLRDAVGFVVLLPKRKAAQERAP